MNDSKYQPCGDTDDNRDERALRTHSLRFYPGAIAMVDHEDLSEGPEPYATKQRESPLESRCAIAHKITPVS